MPKNDTKNSVYLNGQLYAPGAEMPRALKLSNAAKKAVKKAAPEPEKGSESEKTVGTETANNKATETPAV